METSFVKLHLIRIIHISLYRSGRRYLAAARQVRGGRSLLQQRFEHCVWTTRYGERARQDHHRRCGSLHAHRADVVAAGCDRNTFGFAIDIAGCHACADCIAEPERRAGSSSCVACTFCDDYYQHAAVEQTVSLLSRPKRMC